MGVYKEGKSRWFDEEDRAYIFFSVEEIMEMLNCGRNKAVNCLKELDQEKGIGLIEKRRIGLGKTNVIYVKNFSLTEYPDEPAIFDSEETPENVAERMLLQCHKELDGNKAVGVDEITKKEYGRNLEQNLDDLVERLKRKSYKPQPSIRVYIPKSN